MPSVEVHATISKKRTENDFMDLHKWIDEPGTLKGAEHRLDRHRYTTEDREFIKKTWDSLLGSGWGDKAVIEWLLHISMDYLDVGFKMSNNVYANNENNVFMFGFNKEGNIHTTFGTIDKEELNRISESYVYDPNADFEYY
jgi:hypothetical protein